MAPQYHIRFFSYQLTKSILKAKTLFLATEGQFTSGKTPPSQWKGRIPQTMLCETGTLSGL